MTRVYLIRHGETDWNLTGRWQGHTNIPLNNLGLEQARLLARHFAGDVQFAAIYSSDLLRAWQTAEILGRALQVAPQPMLALREIDIGWWGGKTRAEIAARDAATLARIDADEDLPRGDAETLRDLYDRATAALHQLVAAHANATIAIVAHGGTIRALLEYAHTDRHWRWPWPHQSIGNTAVSIIAATPGGWRVELANDMTHLIGAPQAVDVLARSPDDAQQV